MRRLTPGLGFNVRNSGRCQGWQGHQGDLREIDFLEQSSRLNSGGFDGPKADRQTVEGALLQECVGFATPDRVQNQLAFDREAGCRFLDVSPAPDRGGLIMHPQEQWHPAGALVGGEGLLEGAGLDPIAVAVDLAED
jgi:hypothetical protein